MGGFLFSKTHISVFFGFKTISSQNERAQTDLIHPIHGYKIASKSKTAKIGAFWKHQMIKH